MLSKSNKVQYKLYCPEENEFCKMFIELIFWSLLFCCISKTSGRIEELHRIVKQIKLHEVQNILKQMEKQKKTWSCLCDMIKGKGKSHNKQGAATYIRWGRTTCPGNGTELMYTGYAAGAHYSKKGGASNYLCLPTNPNWAKYQDSDDKSHSAKIYGAEYEMHKHVVGEALDKTHAQYEVPCAVCQNTIQTGVYMLPGKTSCFAGWTLEYRGYLMSDWYGHSSSEYICVDANIEDIGSKGNANGRLLYPVEAACGALKCPPYVNHREITCSVCTR